WTRTSSRLPSCATSWPPSSPRNWGAVMLLDDYAQVAGEDVIEHLRQLARPLAGKRLVNVNSTREGGGVAEILRKLVPLARELGIDAQWEVIKGTPEFYECTKAMHNAL